MAFWDGDNFCKYRPHPENLHCVTTKNYFLLQLQIGFGSIEERKKIGISAKALQQ